VPRCDHRGCGFNFRISNISRGKGYWKCNVAVLKDPHFKDDLYALIEKTYSHLHDNSPTWEIWELSKQSAKRLIINHATRLSVNRQVRTAQLLHRLNFLYEIDSSQEGVARDEINKVNAELKATADAVAALDICNWGAKPGRSKFLGWQAKKRSPLMQSPSVRSIHVLSNLGGDRGGEIIFWGGDRPPRHPLAPPLCRYNQRGQPHTSKNKTSRKHGKLRRVLLQNGEKQWGEETHRSAQYRRHSKLRNPTHNGTLFHFL
jgi:hypothetical protein